MTNATMNPDLTFLSRLIHSSSPPPIRIRILNNRIHSLNRVHMPLYMYNTHAQHAPAHSPYAYSTCANHASCETDILHVSDGRSSAYSSRRSGATIASGQRCIHTGVSIITKKWDGMEATTHRAVRLNTLPSQTYQSELFTR